MAEEFQQPASGPALTPKQRELADALSKNPIDLVQQDLRGYLVELIRLEASALVNGGSSVYAVGDYKTTAQDLTANTSEHVVEDETGEWLYCNGAAVSRTTYADLFALIGTSFGTGDGSTTFNLPDARGRAAFFTGTHTNADLGDNDGQSEANRQAKHQHTDTLAVSINSASAGTPSGTISAHSITNQGSVTVDYQSFVGGSSIALRADTGVGGNTSFNVSGMAIASHTFTGSAMSNHGHTGSVTGDVGTGTSGDAPAHVFIGSLLIRF